MATSYTSLLGFALPVTGELQGTWGDVVNNSITQLAEDSIAGVATASVASADWTLSTTGSGASNEARKAILIPTGSPGVSRNVIAPSSSKAYIIANQSNAAVVIKGAATSGVSIPAGMVALVAWNGSDFIKCTSLVTSSTGSLTLPSGTTAQRDSTPATAYVRYNTDNARLEWYNGASWSESPLETGVTGSVVIPSGTTAQRDGTPAAGYFRFNSTLVQFEGYNGTAWGSIGGSGGATGAGNDNVFVENDQVVATNYTLGAGEQVACTISIATPAVITQANAFTAGQAITFLTSGALPTGLSANTIYYVSSTGLSSTSYQVSATLGGSSIATSGTQSGSHTCGKVKNASSAGPVTIASGITVTVPNGASWVVV